MVGRCERSGGRSVGRSGGGRRAEDDRAVGRCECSGGRKVGRRADDGGLGPVTVLMQVLSLF
jgi:hypothetical protein